MGERRVMRGERSRGLRPKGVLKEEGRGGGMEWGRVN